MGTAVAFFPCPVLPATYKWVLLWLFFPCPVLPVTYKWVLLWLFFSVSSPTSDLQMGIAVAFFFPCPVLPVTYKWVLLWLFFSVSSPTSDLQMGTAVAFFFPCPVLPVTYKWVLLWLFLRVESYQRLTNGYCCGFFSVLSHTSDLQMGTAVAFSPCGVIPVTYKWVLLWLFFRVESYQ